ncbi:MAG: hypothetical protein H6618_05135 [Deltaproteobacteria bacterium]|nr:hypothetical protein [Deltaproteobacteria bacterium]
MYDYTEQEGFRLRCVDHEIVFAGLKDYQMLLGAGSLIFCVSDVMVGFVFVMLLFSFFQWSNTRALRQKHITLNQSFLKLVWRVPFMQNLFPHLSGIRATQESYRS